MNLLAYWERLGPEVDSMADLVGGRRRADESGVEASGPFVVERSGFVLEVDAKVASFETLEYVSKLAKYRNKEHIHSRTMDYLQHRSS